MKLGCTKCGIYSAHEPCSDCGQIVHIGEHPYCPHGKALPSKGFEPFYDVALDQVVTGIGDINKACRPHWKDGNLVHIQPRDKSAQYYRELNERREARKHGAGK